MRHFVKITPMFEIHENYTILHEISIDIPDACRWSKHKDIILFSIIDLNINFTSLSSRTTQGK